VFYAGTPLTDVTPPEIPRFAPIQNKEKNCMTNFPSKTFTLVQCFQITNGSIIRKNIIRNLQKLKKYIFYVCKIKL
jgi:hypothetical protein